MSGFTKEIIAKTFTEILDEKPMSKVTVRDIVERCGVNRNTFYFEKEMGRNPGSTSGKKLYSGMYGGNGVFGQR